MDLDALRDLFREVTGIRLTSSMSDAVVNGYLARAHTTIGLAAEWEFHQLDDQAAVTAAGVATVSVPGVYRFETVQHDGGAVLQHIPPSRYDLWPSSRKAQGKPYAWSVRQGTVLRLHPTPDAVYNLLINGWSEPTLLSLGTDEPDWPDADLHPAVAWEAAAVALEIEGDDPDRVVWMRGQADQWFELMFRRYNPELSSIVPARLAALRNGSGAPPIRNDTMASAGGEQ